MNKKGILSVVLVLWFGLLGFAQNLPPKPNPPRLVNDFAKQLNATEIAALEQKLVAYNDSTSSQITVVVVPTTGDYPIADYAFALGRDWGVGQQGKNNGIVILWAATDRKVFIATGYGMEGAIPDAIAKRIVNQVIIPEFKNGMFYRGLDRGADAIFKYATGEYRADDVRPEGEEFPVGLIVFVFIFIVILIVISSKGKGGGGKNNGRGFDAGPVFWPYTTYSGRGRSAGSWGGGGFGGGFGGGGGGFGGFGGGSFGGGGAGGSY